MKKALFLDRDGVINIEKNYVFKIEDFEFTPWIFELCRNYQNEGFHIFVITNQAGIARKLYSEDDFLILTDWMIQQFETQHITITKVFFCPHHPDYSGNCNCRKPNSGLILQAALEFNLDLTQSILIGDKESDLRAGYNAGINNCFYIQDLI